MKKVIICKNNNLQYLIKNDIDPETYVLNTDSKLKDFVVPLNKVNLNTTTENSEENN